MPEKTDNNLTSSARVKSAAVGAVLALHGFTGDGADFEYLKNHYAENAHWETPNLPALPLPELCEILRPCWEKLAGMPRVLLGYSMGGRIALHLAEKISWNANDALVLISASPGLADEREREARIAADEISAKKIENSASAKKFYEEWQKQPLIATQRRLPSPWRERLLARRTDADRYIWSAHLRLLGTGALPSLWDRLVENPAPEITFVVGEEDLKFRNIAGQMQAKLPRSRIIVVPESGHSPHLENPQELAKRLAVQGTEK